MNLKLPAWCLAIVLSLVCAVNAATLTSASPSAVQTGISEGYEYQVTVAGTFGGATVALEIFNHTLQDYVAVTSWTATANETIRATGQKLRFVATGATGATSLAVEALRLPLSTGSGGGGSYVPLSALSTTGGANKVLQFDGSGNARLAPITTQVQADAGYNPPDLQMSALQRQNWELPDGGNGASTWLFPGHGLSGNVGGSTGELLTSAGRHCFYWDDGFQLGNADETPGTRFLYMHSNGAPSVSYPVIGSVPIWLDGAARVGSNNYATSMGIQWVGSGQRAGELVFGITGTDTNNGVPYLSNSSTGGFVSTVGGIIRPFSITQDGPKVGTGKVLTFGDGSTVTSRSDIAALAVSSVTVPTIIPVRAASGAMTAGTVAFTPTSGSVTNYTQVSVTRKTIAGTVGNLTYAKTNGTPGTITVNSSSNTDTSVVTYHAVEGSSDAAPPSIAGTNAITDTLTATSSGGALQWYSNDVLVSGQTAGTYVIRHQDIGLPITVKESGVVSNAITAWHPDDESGYYADYRGDTGTLTTGGGAATSGQVVETWQDQSGNARHITAAATTNAPLLDTTTYSGFTHLNFDGSDNFMRYILPSGTISLPQTAFIVAESKTETANERTFSTSDSGSRMIVATGAASANLNDVINNGAATTGDQMPMNSRRIITARSTATQNAVRVDGGTEVVVTETTGVGYGFWVSGTTAGAAADQRHFALLFYNATLDDTAQIRVRKYLKAKWGTP